MPTDSGGMSLTAQAHVHDCTWTRHQTSQASSHMGTLVLTATASARGTHNMLTRRHYQHPPHRHTTSHPARSATHTLGGAPSNPNQLYAHFSMDAGQHWTSTPFLNVRTAQGAPLLAAQLDCSPYHTQGHTAAGSRQQQQQQQLTPVHIYTGSGEQHMRTQAPPSAQQLPSAQTLSSVCDGALHPSAATTAPETAAGVLQVVVSSLLHPPFSGTGVWAQVD